MLWFAVLTLSKEKNVIVASTIIWTPTILKTWENKWRVLKMHFQDKILGHKVTRSIAIKITVGIVGKQLQRILLNLYIHNYRTKIWFQIFSVAEKSISQLLLNHNYHQREDLAIKPVRETLNQLSRITNRCQSALRSHNLLKKLKICFNTTTLSLVIKIRLWNMLILY